MTENGGQQPQIRLQLTTKDNGLGLPPNNGPILVPSCKVAACMHPPVPAQNLIKKSVSIEEICIVNTGQQLARTRKADSARIFD